MDTKQLQTAWFPQTPKYAVDIRRVLSMALSGVQPYVRRFPAFLKGFNEYVEEYVQTEMEILWDVEIPRGADTFEMEFTGRQIDVDDFEPSTYVTAKDTVIVEGTAEVDVRQLIKNLSIVFRSDITDMDGFVAVFYTHLTLPTITEV